MSIRFGQFELDEQRFELRRNGTLINVQPRVLEILLFLVKHRERLVTQDELRASVWKEMTVSGAGLRQAIREVRAALGEDPKAPRFIETVHGKGYRFLGQQRDLGSHVEAPPSGRRSVVGRRPFFGRQRETEHLHLAANEARSGHGCVVLLHGPPGVGKTRLAQWFATHQRQAGSEVCWGGCREGQSAPPFWPWPEVLNRYTETRDPAVIEPLARDLEHDLVLVAPELCEALGARSAGAADESHERAQSVLAAIATFLRRAAQQAPLTLVLEDLHLADDAALHLLEVIARETADTGLMILGTFRRTEGASRPILGAVAGGSLPRFQGLALDGLPLADLRQWLSDASPTPLSEPVVEALHFSTEGLPLLVQALVDELPTWTCNATTLTTSSEPGSSSRARVKEILGRRLHLLDDPTLQLLRTAAVCGEEFPTAILATVTGEPPSNLLRRLEQAHDHGILKPAAEGSARFAHALHRELLYNELSFPERQKRHAAFAHAFADQLASQPDSIVQTAHHFLEAVPYVELGAAAAHAQKAAEWARARHAYARAANYYERALEVLDLGAADPRKYAELLLALGHTQFIAGEVGSCAATLERTFELTRARGYYDLFCRAILIWFQLRGDAACVDPTFHARISEALPHLREKDASFAQLQVARAMSTMFTAPFSERVSWIQEALTLTRHTTDRRARLEVLRGALLCYTRFTDGTTEVDLTEEMLALAVALRSPENELEGYLWRAHAALELGRASEYERAVATYQKQAAIISAPQQLWRAKVLHAARLYLAGSLGESERVVREAGSLGQNLLGLAGFTHMLIQLFQIGVECADEEAVRILYDVVEGGDRVLAVAPNFHAFVPVVARARLYSQGRDATREYLARATHPHDPLDRNFLPAMVSIADLACSQRDVPAANAAFQMLHGYKDRHAAGGTGSVYFGPVIYWLGRLSLVRGQPENAVQ
ncbi:MAG TPA: AAA family ATPase [Polyangiaceae bacterium]